MTRPKFEFIGIAALALIVVALVLTLMTESPSPNGSGTSGAKDSEMQEVEILQRFDLVGDGYHLLFEELALPGTLEQVSPPEITGDSAADDYIRNLAEERGYRIRRVVALEEDLVEVDSELVQSSAARDWKSLQAAANAEGVNLTVRSGYRGIQDQKDIFVARLASNGVSVSQITSGTQDSGIQETLRLVAPPGYSRHHNGYTIDVRSADSGTFSSSKGFQWMSKNNYENTLKYGFIPSYPEGAVDQGPDPESWEFVWVGRSLIESQIDS